MERGQVYWYKFKEFSYHPVLIVQNNKGNIFSPNVIVVELSSSETVRNKIGKIPTAIKIYNTNYKHYKNWNVINEEICIMCSNIFTINKKELGDYMGTLDNKSMKRVDRALKISLGLEV